MSLNAKVTALKHTDVADNLTLAECNAAPEPDENKREHIEIVQVLKGIYEIKDAIAILELSQTASKGDMAELLDCSKTAVNKRLIDIQNHIREHIPADLRARFMFDHHCRGHRHTAMH